MLVEIRLKKIEYEYLCQATFIPNQFRKELYKAENQNTLFLLKMSDSLASEIRDLCGVQLQRVGFDVNYDPTPEGVILEDLIDRFFIG